MPTKSKTEDQRAENGAHIIPPSAVYTQPWWRGIGNNAMPSLIIAYLYCVGLYIETRKDEFLVVAGGFLS
ncbi:hypothetical protein Acr_15g0014230 [Actinidia rufa]|uniref:Uncharacterized protein n=1 Tax=Actinidia rufa TaxID=165716 RepID=A0A7J0FVV8_9ERIC|nr:hypothetical protein Acr_15g0014230 [Actinidia rufa]